MSVVLLFAVASYCTASDQASPARASTHFANDVVPILTKLTCNSGNCHGKSGGQNGFRLSLLGFDAEADYEAIVRESRGRRLAVGRPETSLLLRKAAGRQAHAGGKWMNPDDANYRVLAEWIRSGAGFGDPKAPTPVSVAIVPHEAVMKPKDRIKLKVVATLSNGQKVDVTDRSQFLANDDSVAAVDESGAVTTKPSSGEAAIMARYAGKVGVFRAIVPIPQKDSMRTGFNKRNFIDQWTDRKWQALGLQPSPCSTDAQFLRRVTLDLCGRLPTPLEVRSFLASTLPDKRDRAIDRLLDSPDYATMQAMRWGAILHNRRGSRPEGVTPSHAMSNWLKDAFAADMPYDQLARAIVTARGTADRCPPAVWYRNVRTAEDNVDQISQMFLGVRVQCARCHHHPYDKWSQDDYYGMASFFARIERKRIADSRTALPTEAIVVKPRGAAIHLRTGMPMPAKPLEGEAIETADGADPRVAFADWMTARENPYFARAAVNRVWGQMLGRGIVEPVDDMRVTNPPTNSELLDALAADFVAKGYRMKHLLRTICQSATYQLASAPTTENALDRQNFARFYARRLPAEVLLDALDSATGAKTSLGFPTEMRVVELPDERPESYFLDTFGRPLRASSCECERSNDSNLGQALHLLNSKEVQEKLMKADGLAQRFAKDGRPTPMVVEEIYLRVLARLPQPNEEKTATSYLSSSKDRRKAMQSLLWSLLNSKEFQFNY